MYERYVWLRILLLRCQQRQIVDRAELVLRLDEIQCLPGEVVGLGMAASAQASLSSATSVSATF